MQIKSLLEENGALKKENDALKAENDALRNQKKDHQQVSKKDHQQVPMHDQLENFITLKKDPRVSTHDDNVLRSLEERLRENPDDEEALAGLGDRQKKLLKAYRSVRAHPMHWTVCVGTCKWTPLGEIGELQRVMFEILFHLSSLPGK